MDAVSIIMATRFDVSELVKRCTPSTVGTPKEIVHTGKDGQQPENHNLYYGWQT